MKKKKTKKKIKPIIVLGLGGHAKVLIDILLQTGNKIIGISDPNENNMKKYRGLNILSSDSEIYNYSTKDIELVNGIGLYTHRELSSKLTKKFKQKGYVFANVIHPSAYISTKTKLGYGVQIMAGAILQTGVSVGNFSIVNTGAIIDHDCLINESCHISPGVTMCGNVTIGKKTHIGAGSTIIENIDIGSKCNIVAGSVIFKNIISDTKYIKK